MFFESQKLFERRVGPGKNKARGGSEQNPGRAEGGPVFGNNWQREPQKPRKHLLGLTGAEEDKTQERQSGVCRLKNQAISTPRRYCPGKHSNEPTSSWKDRWLFGAMQVGLSGTKTANSLKKEIAGCRRNQCAGSLRS